MSRADAFVYVANSVTGKISIFEMDAMGGLEPCGSVELGGKAMPIVPSPDGKFLYAGFYDEDFSVASFVVDPATGGLRLLSVAPLPGNMAFLSLDAGGRFLLCASYRGHVIAVVPVNEGVIGREPVCAMPFGLHPHSILADPSNRFVYAPRLGDDRIAQFAFDADAGALTPLAPPFVEVQAGSGPRHIRFSPDGRFAYVLHEMDGCVVSYAHDAASGCLTERGRASIVPPGFPLERGIAGYYSPENVARRAADPASTTGHPKMWAADIHVTPNGRHVYASERASSILARISADPDSGELAFVKIIETEKQPRSFKIDPSGRFLIVSGELAEGISVYAIDDATGDLCLLGRRQVGVGSGWVEIIRAL